MSGWTRDGGSGVREETLLGDWKGGSEMGMKRGTKVYSPAAGAMEGREAESEGHPSWGGGRGGGKGEGREEAG